jgi:hypothetical protein
MYSVGIIPILVLLSFSHIPLPPSTPRPACKEGPCLLWSRMSDCAGERRGCVCSHRRLCARLLLAAPGRRGLHHCLAQPEVNRPCMHDSMRHLKPHRMQLAGSCSGMHEISLHAALMALACSGARTATTRLTRRRAWTRPKPSRW